MTVDHTAAPGTGGLDAAAWVRRWERQQAHHVADRETTFTLMLDVLDRLGAAPGRLLDLGCGPGSLAARVLGRWPHADVVGLDLDPVLMDLGRRTLGDRIRWLEADLREPLWDQPLGGAPFDAAPFDAAVSATALHWLDPEHLAAVATGLARHLRPGGVFVNYDTLLLDESTPRLRAVSQDLHLAAVEQAGGDELRDGWWAALAAEPELTGRLAERRHRLGAKRSGPNMTCDVFARAFRDAGFREVGILRQVADRRMVVAIR